MKKVALIFASMLITIVSLFASPKNDKELILKFGVQPLNLSNLSSGNKSYPVNTGVSAGLEYFQYLNIKYLSNIAAFGLGARYYLPRKLADAVDGSPEFSFMPLFAALKLRMYLSGFDNTFMFLSGRLGYTIPMISKLPAEVSSKGGPHYGFGIGFSRKFLVIELMSTICNFSLQSEDLKTDTRFTLSELYVGYKFDL